MNAERHADYERPPLEVVTEWIAVAFNHTIPNTNPPSYGPNTVRLAKSLLQRLADLDMEIAPAGCPKCGRWLSLHCAVDGDIDWYPAQSDGTMDGINESKS